MSGESAPAPTRAAFIFVFITIMLDMLALGLIIPVLPKLIKAFMGGDTAGAASIVGYFGTAWAFMQFVFQPVLGALSDRFGRRPVIILSNLGLGADYILMALAPSLWVLFVGRIISGVTAASYSTAGAYIADVTPPEQRAARFGMLGAAFGFGFVVGPAVGGWLGDIGLRLPFWVAAFVSLANGVYGMFVLPESLPRERRAPFSFKRANPIASVGFLRSNPVLFRLSVTAFLQRLAYSSLPSMFVLYTDYRYGWNARMEGAVLAAVGVAQTIVSGVLIRPAIKRLGERRVLLLGLSSGVVGMLIYAGAPTGAIFLAALAPVAVWNIANAAIQGLSTRQVSATEQGRLQGAQSSLGGIADMMGPIMFTNVFAVAISASGPLHLPGAPYLLAGMLVMAALFVSAFTIRPALASAE